MALHDVETVHDEVCVPKARGRVAPGDVVEVGGCHADVLRAHPGAIREGVWMNLGEPGVVVVRQGCRAGGARDEHRLVGFDRSMVLDAEGGLSSKL